jgi:hypothetical protein
LRELHWGNYQLPLNTWITVRIEVIDNTVRGYINGRELVKVTDEPPRLKGRIGFAVTANSTVWFDDVRVVELMQR